MLRYPLIVCAAAVVEAALFIWDQNSWNGFWFGLVCGCAFCSVLHWWSFRRLWPS